MVADVRQMFEGKRVLVTGGLGSIGSEIVKKLVQYGVQRITVIDNRETELHFGQLQNKDERVFFEFADVRDFSKINELMKAADIVFHAAAMKHVIICEQHPYDAIQTNIIGTKNIIEAAISNDIQKVILISTDKAVNPTNVMGATKLLAEKLIAALVMANRPSKTAFGVVRFGNVLNSRGSVLEIWGQQLARGEPITVTDPEMTRFFMSVSQSVDLIFSASRYAKQGETFVLKMSSVKLKDLAKAFLKAKNLDPETVKIVGRQKGEKMHEELILETEDDHIYENKEMFVSLPAFISNERISELKKDGFQESSITQFKSNNVSFLLKSAEIDALLSVELAKQN
ncbi:MAG: SDR family NAD(P)-dependent oxidoreductase [Candidatus Diapherotrites archaeon]|nr:SDR family NAD(P)-dependent oxidoreductase [Candidatus Diapherotrites archaeon]